MTQETSLPTDTLPPLIKKEDRLYSYTDKIAEDAYFALVNEWVADAEIKHASLEQAPASLQDGIGLHFQKISLYHGGYTAGIVEFNGAGLGHCPHHFCI